LLVQRTSLGYKKGGQSHSSDRESMDCNVRKVKPSKTLFRGKKTTGVRRENIFMASKKGKKMGKNHA